MERKHVPLSPLREFVELLLANIVIRIGNLRSISKIDILDSADQIRCTMKILKISLTKIQENHKETHINGEKRLGTLNPLLKPWCADRDDCKTGTISSLPIILVTIERTEISHL